MPNGGRRVRRRGRYERVVRARSHSSAASLLSRGAISPTRPYDVTIVCGGPGLASAGPGYRHARLPAQPRSGSCHLGLHRRAQRRGLLDGRATRRHTVGGEPSRRSPP